MQSLLWTSFSEPISSTPFPKSALEETSCRPSLCLRTAGNGTIDKTEVAWARGWSEDWLIWLTSRGWGEGTVLQQAATVVETPGSEWSSEAESLEVGVGDRH